jgi:hypothetical protein
MGETGAPNVSVRLISDDGHTFTLEARVREGGSETNHTVTLGHDVLARLARGESAEGFVRRCFAFLLEREPKESILRRFDVSIIARYFPEFDETIAAR